MSQIVTASVEFLLPTSGKSMKMVDAFLRKVGEECIETVKMGYRSLEPMQDMIFLGATVDEDTLGDSIMPGPSGKDENFRALVVNVQFLADESKVYKSAELQKAVATSMAFLVTMLLRCAKGFKGKEFSWYPQLCLDVAAKAYTSRSTGTYMEFRAAGKPTKGDNKPKAGKKSKAGKKPSKSKQKYTGAKRHWSYDYPATNPWTGKCY